MRRYRQQPPTTMGGRAPVGAPVTPARSSGSLWGFVTSRPSSHEMSGHQRPGHVIAAGGSIPYQGPPGSPGQPCVPHLDGRPRHQGAHFPATFFAERGSSALAAAHLGSRSQSYRATQQQQQQLSTHSPSTMPTPMPVPANSRQKNVVVTPPSTASTTMIAPSSLAKPTPPPEVAASSEVPNVGTHGGLQWAAAKDSLSSSAKSQSDGSISDSSVLTSTPSLAAAQRITRNRQTPVIMDASPTCLDQPSPTAQFDATEEEIQLLTTVLESFYVDMLRPFQQDLKRRIRERGGGEELLANFLAVYQRRTDLFVVCEWQGKPIVTLKNPPDTFRGWIDPNDGKDPYPQHLWDEFKQYITDMLSASSALDTDDLSSTLNPRTKPESQHCTCSSGSETSGSICGDSIATRAATRPNSVRPPPGFEDQLLPSSTGCTKISDFCPTCGLSLDNKSSGIRNSTGKGAPVYQKGGRYGMASELYSRSLPLLRGYSLGEVCHIVQLAIVKGILAYENELLKPVSACTKISIANCSTAIGLPAESQMSNSELGFPHIEQKGQPVSDLEQAKAVVASVLANEPQGIHLAHLKQRILKNHQKYITPTAFGYEKLSALLSSGLFADTCYLLRDDRQNHMIVQSTKFPIRQGTKPFISSKTEAKARLEGAAAAGTTSSGGDVKRGGASDLVTSIPDAPAVPTSLKGGTYVDKLNRLSPEMDEASFLTTSTTAGSLAFTSNGSMTSLLLEGSAVGTFETSPELQNHNVAQTVGRKHGDLVSSFAPNDEAPPGMLFSRGLWDNALREDMQQSRAQRQYSSKQNPLGKGRQQQAGGTVSNNHTLTSSGTGASMLSASIASSSASINERVREVARSVLD